MKVNFKICFGVTLSLFIALCIYFNSSLQELTIKFSSKQDPTQFPYQEEVISQLKEILSDLETYKLQNSIIGVKLAKVLYMLNSDQDEDQTSFEPPIPATHSLKSPIFSCPDKFLHAKYGDPYFINGTWETPNCGKVQPIHKSLTVILTLANNPSCTREEKNTILGIKKLYPQITILVAVPSKTKCVFDSSITNIITHQFSTKTSLGEKLNKLISNVKTPLVLLGHYMDHFDWLSRLDRQLSVFSVDSESVIVGGSLRNSTGHWQTGCHQTTLKFYILKYIEGYYKSKYECMYCDYLQGPFVARTKFLLGNKFDEELDSEVVFDDFFLRIKTSPSRILMCPDAMYHATDPGTKIKSNNRKSWLQLTKKWTLNRIVLANGIIHKFSCSESDTDCNNLYRKVGAKLMPICCRDAFVNGFKVIHKFCVDHKVTYQILGGSTLGAVKLQDIIPWDFDGDAAYYKNKEKLFAKKLDLSNTDGKVYVDHIGKKAKGFFYLSLPDAYIEFWAQPKLSVDVANLSEIYHVKPTLVRIDDAWVYSPPSPGLYARNYYGYEMLRHSNGYIQLGRGYWFTPYDTSISFIKCKKRHHACLDQYETDGSIQFAIP